MKSGGWLAGSIVAAVAASLCCILPIAIAILGVSVVGAAAAFAAWRPYLLVATAALLAAGFYFAYRPGRRTCAPNGACEEPAVKRRGRGALWAVSVLVLAFAAFPYYSGPVAGWLGPQKRGAAMAPSGKIQQTTLAIEGMDCPACAVAITNNLKGIPGVVSAQVSYHTGRATIRYEAGKVSSPQLAAAVAAAGYRSHPL